MTDEDVTILERWKERHPNMLFPMSIVYLYPDSWRSIIELMMSNPHYLMRGEK